MRKLQNSEGFAISPIDAASCGPLQSCGPLPGHRVTGSASGPVRRVLGIDPGLASTGYGIIEYRENRYRHLCHGVIETEAGIPHGERLLYLFDTLDSLLEQFSPGEAGMETLYFAKNVTSAMYVAEARGVLGLCLARRGIPLGEYPPPVIKKAVVGSARAEKKLVQEYVRLLLGMESIPNPDHAADALAAAITHIHSGLITGNIDSDDNKRAHQSRN